MNKNFFRSMALALAVVPAIAGLASAQATTAPKTGNPFYAMDTSFQRPGLTFQQQLDLVKQLGYAGTAWHENDPAQVREALAATEKSGLKMVTIYCAAEVNAQGDITWSPQLPKLMEVLDGHGTIIWLHIGGRGPAFDRLKDDSPAVVKLRSLAKSAEAHGLSVAIYPHFGEWTAHFADATRLARLVHHPRFGVTFNLCHALAGGDEKQIPQLLEEAKPVLATVTICGADSGVSGPQWNRLIRTLDRGSFDVGQVLRTLRKIDFRGPIGFQGYAIPGDARSILAPTMSAWRKLTEK